MSKVAIIAKEGHGEAKQIASDIAKLFLGRGFQVLSFPYLHLKSVEHVQGVKDLKTTGADLFVTVSGDGTILRFLRILDSVVPFLCVNVGGRGILSEIKPGQVEMALDRIESGDLYLEKRQRIRASISESSLPPALNEIYVQRNSVTRTPLFTIEFDKGAVFGQRMDGIIVSTPTGSTGHSFSYKGPYLDGSLNALAVTPVGPIRPFPAVVRRMSEIRVMANYPLRLVVDGQETFSVQADTYISVNRHERDAHFVRLDVGGPYRQLRNLGFD